jgi:hypothetical protein
VPSGSFVTVDVVAADDSGIANCARSWRGWDRRTRRHQRRAAARAGPSLGRGRFRLEVRIFAEAFDDLGQSSGQQVLTFDISDGTAPTVAVTAPAPNTLLSPGDDRAADARTGGQLRRHPRGPAVGGAFTRMVETVIDAGGDERRAVVQLNVPADAPTNGEPVTLTLTARDAAGNMSDAVTHRCAWWTTRRRTVLSTVPLDGATGVDREPTYAWCSPSRWIPPRWAGPFLLTEVDTGDPVEIGGGIGGRSTDRERDRRLNRWR